jgi:alpha-2-macroglobulin
LAAGPAAPASAAGARGPAGPAGGFGGGGIAERQETRKAKQDAQEPQSGAGGARTKFADTAFWTPAVVTNAKGEASVEVTWPDNLTQWRANAVGNSANAQVGSGDTSVRVRKDLLVRLQAPRFFVERDLVLLSANVHNYQERAARVKVNLNLGDSTAELANPDDMRGMSNSVSGEAELWVDVPKEGEKRVDWAIRVRQEGQLKVRMAAQAQSASDATELTFPVLVHGVERATAQGGVMRAENRAELAINLPEARKPGSSELVVQLNPSLAATMLDSLPYLIEYPYGCIEQTVSRFIPAVVVSKTLSDLGYDLKALGERARQLEAKEKAGDAAQPGGKTVKNSPYSYPKGRPGTIRVSHLAKPQTIRHSPVFDPEELKHIVSQGLARIQGFQHGDGGWGWWPGDASDPYMTAYVLYGLKTAKDAGHPVDAQMLERGFTFLQGRYLEDDNFHRMAYEARVLAMEPGRRTAIRELTAGRLFQNRERLSAYSRALLATALHLVGDKEKAEIMLRNVETTAKVDDANGTANWGESSQWWCWWNNKVETNAAVLQAYMLIRPEATLPPMMVKWLVNNRRGNQWYSTRETAMAVYALADYSRVNKELSPDYALTLDLGGRVKRSYTVNRENALFFDNQFIVPDELMETGNQTLSFTKQGEGTLYYTAYTRYFSLEEPIKATGNEVFVKRRYFRLVPGTASGQPLDAKLATDRPNPFLTGQYELLTAGGEYTGSQDTDGGPRYERQPLNSGDVVTSGDQIEVELHIESKNDYEYLVFEDLKPAGCEPVEVRSGTNWGGGLYSNMELRDQKVAFFLTHLPQGTRTITYRLRAEIPGQFHVLPTNGYAMYAPDIRCLSDEMNLAVKDQ